MEQSQQVVLVPARAMDGVLNELQEIKKTLAKLEPSGTAENELYSPHEAAKFLGVSEQYVRLHQKEIGFTKLGSNVRFRRNDLEEFASANYFKR